MTQTDRFLNDLEEKLKNNDFQNFITSRESFESKDLNSALFENEYSPSVISKALTEMLMTSYGKIKLHIDFRKAKTYEFFYCDYDNCATVTYEGKEKNILTFTLNFITKDDNKNAKIYYDFNSNDFVNRKDFKNITVVPKTRKENDDLDFFFFSSIVQNKKCVIPEWVFSYSTTIEALAMFDNGYYGTFRNINAYGDYKDIENCPKGYINYINAHNLVLSYETVKTYERIIKLGKFGNSIYEYIRCAEDEAEFLNNNKNIIFKIIKNSWTVGEIEDATIISLCRYIHENMYIVKDNLNLLNENATVEQFMNNISDVRNKELNARLKEKLTKLNFLQDMIINDEYIIKVPQDLRGLKDEGEQQHNCVGHYYNDSIMQGRNLIYFLRDKNAPNKSLITCRYNINSRKTVEHRRPYNNSTNKTDCKAIQEIDKIINNTFFKKESD